MSKELWKYELGRDWNLSGRQLDAKFQTERLLRSPPHVVADYLEEFARQTQRNRFSQDYASDQVPPDQEPLLATGDPLIRLALARWGTAADVVDKILRDSTSGTAERLAVLMNPCCFRSFSTGFVDVFVSAKWPQVLRDATNEERRAIAANPSVNDSVFADVISALITSDTDEDREVLMGILIGLPANDILTEDHFDYPFEVLRETIWSLALKLPAEDPWTYRLAILFKVMLSDKTDNPFTRKDGVPDKENLEAAIQRWTAISEPEAARNCSTHQTVSRERFLRWT